MNGTPYSVIYETFIRKIKDFDFISLDYDIFQFYVNGYLKSAIANFPNCTEIQDRDDINEVFKCNLSLLIIEALAHLMIEEWISPQLYNELNIKQFIGDKDYKTFSQANHLDKLQKLKDFSNNEAKRKIMQYSNANFDFGSLR